MINRHVVNLNFLVNASIILCNCSCKFNLLEITNIRYTYLLKGMQGAFNIGG
jgi:hypothetical protein